MCLTSLILIQSTRLEHVRYLVCLLVSFTALFRFRNQGKKLFLALLSEVGCTTLCKRSFAGVART
jgi:hypothetical protein